MIVATAVASVVLVVRRFHIDPQTDDAEVFANLIGIAPEVEGRITKINVKDNQFVRKGELLFQIDPVPYQYALEIARSQQATLEGQVRDLQRRIGAQTSAIQAARASSNSAQAKIASADAAVEAARASVDAAKAELSREQADYAYAENNVLRLEPLLVQAVRHGRHGGSSPDFAVREGRGGSSSPLATGVSRGPVGCGGRATEGSARLV